MGRPITETVASRFPDAKTLAARSVVVTGDGTSMSFAFVGRRTEAVQLAGR